MIRKLVMFSMTVAGVALAAPSATAPAFTPGAMTCTGGTHQVMANGGTMSGCAKMVNGKPVFTGPVVRLYDSGKVESLGQMENGQRTGKWVAYTKDGKLSAEIEFLADRLHGRRLEYNAAGQVVLDETWVNGKREGVQKMADAKGVMVISEYRNDVRVR